MNNHYHYSSRPKYKSSASFLYQKFLSIDKRMRLNIVIGASLFTIVVVTGIVLAMISLVQFGGSLIEEAFGEGKEEVFRSFQNEKIQKNVEKNHSPRR